MSMQQKSTRSVILEHLGSGVGTTVVSDSTLLINGADFPRWTSANDSSLLGFALFRRPSDGFHYDIRMFAFKTGSHELRFTETPYPENVDAEHGFGSFFRTQQGLWLTWVDGRQFAGKNVGHDLHTGGGQSELRASLLDNHSAEPIVLDGRICDCCQTAAVSFPSGEAVVFYRDRSENEIRDVSFVRFDGNKWSEPAALCRDSWVISGCPVNGPAAIAFQSEVYAAWFTAPTGSGKVKFAYSSDKGNSFDSSIEVSIKNVIGRVSISGYSTNRTAFLTWLEQAGDEMAVVKIAQLRNGKIAKGPVTVDSISAKRVSGFPQVIFKEGTLYVAYTTETGIKLAETTL
jgi:hypothetical protein